MASTIFITGATGLIGQALCRRLAGEGHQLRAWVRSPKAAANKLGPDVELFAASGGAEKLLAGITGADAVIHLAGEPVFRRRWNPEVKRSLVASRVDLTGQVVHAIEQLSERPRVFISASAVGYYGMRGDEPVDESGAPGDDFFGELCQKWEAAAAPAAQLGVRLVCMRIGIVLAPEGGALEEMATPVKYGIAGPLGSGRQYMSWIHLEDMVNALCRALTDEALHGPVNATAPNPVQNREMMKTLGRVLNRPVFMPVPAFALRLLKGEMAVYLTTGQRVMPKRLQDVGFSFAYSELEQALTALLA